MHFSIRNGDFATLRHELEEFGYLFIRGFHPDNLIKIARKGKDFSSYFKIIQKVSFKNKYQFQRVLKKKIGGTFGHPKNYLLYF